MGELFETFLSFTSRLLHKCDIYGLRLSTVSLIMLVGVCVWTVAGCASSGRQRIARIWKALNAVGIVVGFYGILFYSVLRRVPSETHVFVWDSWHGSQYWREMWMNAFLYLPFGLTMTVWTGPWSILIGLVCSGTIELWQYLTGSGCCQATDIFMNTLGCAIGALPWAFEVGINRGLKRRKKK